MRLAAVVVMVALGVDLTAQQERGREIFLQGRSSTSQPIYAVLGSGNTPIDATIVPCANCHGEAGRGRPEGGVRPADISPAVLGRNATIGQRKRSAYTRPLLKRVVTMGYDASGNALDQAMPRFALSRQDADDLLAYLEILGKDPQPGIRDDVIFINVLGAPDLVAPTTIIFGRKIQLLRERGTNAFLTIDATSDGSASVEVADRDHIPTIAVHSAHAPPGPYSFVLTAMPQDQIAALLASARGKNSEPVLFTADCNGLAHSQRDALILMTSAAAANCDLATIPAAFDQRVIVAAAIPPAIQAGSGVANAELSLVVAVLSRLGRDVSRNALIAALEHVYRTEVSGLPPITWSANRHFGTTLVWLMTLDVRRQRLINEPGWTQGG